jgi:hypothetical protein
VKQSKAKQQIESIYDKKEMRRLLERRYKRRGHGDEASIPVHSEGSYGQCPGGRSTLTHLQRFSVARIVSLVVVAVFGFYYTSNNTRIIKDIRRSSTVTVSSGTGTFAGVFQKTKKKKEKEEAMTSNNNTPLDVETFVQIQQKLMSIIEDDTVCHGLGNHRVCDRSVLDLLCIHNDSDVRVPNIQYTVGFTPWLTMGNYTWTANEYNDFILWYIFFSGRVAVDAGGAGPEKQQEKKFYFETGASNGIHASQTYTMGEQLGWDGLLAELSLCGPCQATINHPSPTLVHTGICAEDTTMPYTDVLKYSFCDRRHSCDASEKETIPCQTLSTLFRTHNVTHIDFLSLDIEEHTATAWHSIDHTYTNVRMAMVEHLANPVPVEVDTDVFYRYKTSDDWILWRKDFVIIQNPCKSILQKQHNTTSNEI